MQKSNQVSEFTLFPVPTEMLEEVELDLSRTVQYSVSRGRLVIEPIYDEEEPARHYPHGAYPFQKDSYPYYTQMYVQKQYIICKHSAAKGVVYLCRDTSSLSW